MSPVPSTLCVPSSPKYALSLWQPKLGVARKGRAAFTVEEAQGGGGGGQKGMFEEKAPKPVWSGCLAA